MPYTKLDQLPDAVKKLPVALQKLWMEVWNNAFESCIKNGGGEFDCEGSAAAQAWGVVNKFRSASGACEWRSAVPFQDLPLGDRDQPWDRDAAEPRVRKWASSDGSGEKDTIDWAKYRKAFFWYDENNPENFGSYKLMFADVEGGKLKAMPRAVFTAAAVMQGARGGADIPESDRNAVKNHIARYYAKMRDQYDDQNIIAPWERSYSGSIEWRYMQKPFLRMEANPKPMIVGYAAVFDRIAELSGFKEKIRRGAFARTINNHDVRALFNHDRRMVLGRCKNGTLRLNEDEKGLAVEIDLLTGVPWIDGLAKQIERGDINQMSIAFETLRDEWDAEHNIRTLLEVRLWDVSVVTYPAYEETSAHIRSVLTDYGIDQYQIMDALGRASLKSMTREDESLLRHASQVLQALLPAENESKPRPDTAQVHSGVGDGDAAEVHSRSVGLDLIRKKLHVLELDLNNL